MVSRGQRFTSYDVDAFEVPTGREEEWRFTPLARLRPLLEPFAPEGKLLVDVQAPDGVEVRQVDASDPMVGCVLVPADRVSALAMATVDQALVVSISRQAAPAATTVVTMRGEPGTAYGHLVVDVAEGAQGTVVPTPSSGWAPARR